MKTPQIKPDWKTGIWNGRTIMTDQTEEPRCPQCGAMSRWIDQEVAAECDTCEAHWTETKTTTERTAR